MYTMKYHIQLIQQLLDRKTKGMRFETAQQKLAYERGYLTGILARLALKDPSLARLLKRIAELK